MRRSVLFHRAVRARAGLRPSVGGRGRRPARLLTGLTLALAAAVGPGLASPASADAGPEVTAATNSFALSSGSTTLSSLTVTGSTSGQQLQVVLSTTRGTLYFPHTGGLSLSYGNDWTGTDSVDFVGTAAAANAALADAQLVGDSSVGDAKVTLTAFAAEADDLGSTVFAASNGHFYSYVQAPRISWTDARAAARTLTYRGQSGYLATIPDARINDLLAERVQGATNVWFGGHAVNTEGEQVQRTWSWADGPLAGSVFTECTNLLDTCQTQPTTAYSHWAEGEPNNAAGTESASVINWNGVRGEWNDLMSYRLYDFLPLGGYLVEYGDQAVGADGGFDGVSAASATIPMLAQAPDVAPGQVVGLASTPGNASAGITFRAPADNGGSPVTAYQAKVGDADWADIVPQLDNGTYTYRANGLSNGTSYVIAVRAVNAAGNGVVDTTTVTPVQPVEKTPLVVTARDVSHAWGLAHPTFTATVSGLAEGDSLTRQPTCKVAAKTPDVGSYPITCSGAKASSRYTLTYRPGTLTITRAATVLTVGRVPGKTFKPTATLTRADTGAGVPGRTVSFTFDGSGRSGCTAVTNSRGVATCKAYCTVSRSLAGSFAGTIDLVGSDDVERRSS